MLGDISNVHNNIDLLYILTAVLIVDMVVILIARDTTLLGKSVNEWYSKFTLTAVILDVLIIIIGFITTRYVFNVFDLKFTPELFIVVLITIQVIHDALLYLLVIKPYPDGNNQIIDLYKKYANDGGSKIIVADSAMVLISALLAMYLKNKELHETTSLLIWTLYTIPYFIYQKVKY